MAEDFNHTDQIIRGKFESFEPEPPIQVWEKIKTGIPKTPPPPSSSGIILPIVVAISVLIFLSGLIHHFTAEKNAATKEGKASLAVQSAGVISTGSTSITDVSLQESFYQTPVPAPDPIVSAPSTSPEKENAIPVRAPFEQSRINKNKKEARENKASALAGSPTRTGQWKPGLVQSIISGNLSYADAAKYNLSPRDVRKLSGFTDDYAKRNQNDWSISFYFNPEVNHSQDASIENTMSYNLGFMPGINFNHFFIQGGVNVRYTHDKGNLAVDYNRYLGSYEDVYEVTFDSTGSGIIPTYHTQTVDVYDTINHYSISETKANYTYLEIPLLAGYRYTFGKLSVFGKAGPAASFLVYKNVPEAGYPEDKARIVNVNYQIPVRSTINWQLMMGAGIDYRLAEKFSISFEPTFRYTIKSYNLSTEGKNNTTSFGIRAGLNYNF
jgi:hypothetical protein